MREMLAFVLFVLVMFIVLGTTKVELCKNKICSTYSFRILEK
jgi:hypothetical protein